MDTSVKGLFPKRLDGDFAADQQLEVHTRAELLAKYAKWA